jgi:hypothetical protein
MSDFTSQSLFRFEGQDHYEIAPACVIDALRQMTVLDHSPDVQFFDFDALVLSDQLSRFFVVKIAPLSFHLQMFLRQHPDRFLSPFAPLDSA